VPPDGPMARASGQELQGVDGSDWMQNDVENMTVIHDIDSILQDRNELESESVLPSPLLNCTDELQISSFTNEEPREKVPLINGEDYLMLLQQLLNSNDYDAGRVRSVLMNASPAAIELE